MFSTVLTANYYADLQIILPEYDTKLFMLLDFCLIMLVELIFKWWYLVLKFIHCMGTPHSILEGQD